MKSKKFRYHSISFFALRGLPFLSAILTARLLGAEEFGVYIAAVNLLIGVTLLADIGVSLSTTALVAKFSSIDPERARAIFDSAIILALIFSLIVGLGLLLLSNQLSVALVGDLRMSEMLAAGTVYVPAVAIFLVLNGGLSGFQRYKEAALIGVLGGGIFFVCSFAAALSKDATLAVWGASFGMLLRTAVAACILSCNGQKFAVPKLGLLRRDLVALCEFSAPALVAALAYSPVLAIVTLVLISQPTGAPEAGGFGVGLQLFALISVAPTIITQFALPRLSAANGETAHAVRSRILLQYAAASFALTALIVAPVVLFMEDLLRLFGSDYAEYVTAIQILLTGAIFSAPHGVLSNYFLAVGRVWLRAATHVVWGVTVLFCLFQSAERDSLAAAKALTLAWMVLVSLQSWLVVLDLRAKKRAA